MLIGLLISFLALVGFVFSIVLLLAAVIKYGVFLFAIRRTDSRAKAAIEYILLKNQSEDLSVAKLFCISVLFSMLLVLVISLVGS